MGVAPRGSEIEIALRREAEDLILIEIEARMLEELLDGIALLQEIDHFAQPFEGAFRRRAVIVDMLAIAPMRRHAALGDFVHLLGADLHFDALLLRTDHRRVDGAVAVGLRVRDEILEALRDHAASSCAARPARDSSPLPSSRSRGSRKCRTGIRS